MVILLLSIVCVLLVIILVVLFGRSSGGNPEEILRKLSAEVRGQASIERDAAVKHAVEQVSVVAKEQLAGTAERQHDQFNAAAEARTLELRAAVESQKDALHATAELQQAQLVAATEAKTAEFKSALEAKQQEFHSTATENTQALVNTIEKQQEAVTASLKLQQESLTSTAAQIKELNASELEAKAKIISAAIEKQQQALAQSLTNHQSSIGATATLIKETNAQALDKNSEVIGTALSQIQEEMRSELKKLASSVGSFRETSAESLGKVSASLENHMQTTTRLSESTEGLRSALANSQARGQWGERMAEDVIRSAGLLEKINYEKQKQEDGGKGRPDFKFLLPKGQEMYMDVKFPMASYLDFLSTQNDRERSDHLSSFLKAVRARIKELADRKYGGGKVDSIESVLLFIPNEQMIGVIHENDPELINHALSLKVVLVSPLTLFALLGVIRQAVENFSIEQKSNDILRLLEKFESEWVKYTTAVDAVQKKFDSTQTALAALSGPRRRALERPLKGMREIREQRPELVGTSGLSAAPGHFSGDYGDSLLTTDRRRK